MIPAEGLMRPISMRIDVLNFHPVIARVLRIWPRRSELALCLGLIAGIAAGILVVLRVL